MNPKMPLPRKLNPKSRLSFSVAVEGNERADQYLHKTGHFGSVRDARRFIERGGFGLNGEKYLRSSRRLQRGDGVELFQTTAPEGEHLDILFEDEHLLAVNKRSGLLSMPDGKRNRNLFSMLSQSRPHEVGAVHRLDRDTSGLILFGKSHDVTLKLQNMFRDRKISKTYRALTYAMMPVSSKGTWTSFFKHGQPHAETQVGLRARWWQKKL